MFPYSRSISSVSYTHLDVYKRQVKEELKSGGAKRASTKAKNISLRAKKAKGKARCDDITAVSYTHLDVYKRQALKRRVPEWQAMRASL